MITMTEVAAGIYGAFRLARRDPGGLAWFDTSLTGYWRSFWAAAAVAPAYVVLALVAGGLSHHMGVRPVTVQVIAYVIDWTAFPVLMITVANSLGKWPNYTRYIVAYNWSAVVQMALLLPIAVLAVLFPSPATLMLAQFVTVILLVYRAYVVHVALEAGYGASAGIVLMDVLLAALLKAITDRMMAG